MEFEISLPQDLEKLEALARTDVPEGTNYCKVSATLLLKMLGVNHGA